jgi:hypothetical protein
VVTTTPRQLGGVYQSYMEIRYMPFEDLRKRFSDREMQSDAVNIDELRQMAPEDGLLSYIAVSLPQTRDSAKRSRYLWVLTATDLPYALELCVWAKTLESGMLKHSNLTGGGRAYIGGELWFVSEDRLVINFCSGRYGARDDGDMELAGAIIEALVEDGYAVATTGRDEEQGFPSSRVLIGQPEYREPKRETNDQHR